VAGVDGELGGRVVGKSLSATWVDFNEDGWLDLYVANDVSDNHLYLNNGGGTFRERAARAWLADPRGAMGMAVADFDNDQDSDLFISHWIAQENALYVNLARQMSEGGLNGGDPVFSDRADILGLGQSSLDFVGWGVDFFDFDGDGFLDLFVANGSTFEDAGDRTRLVPMRSLLYRHQGMKEVVADGQTKRLPKGFVDCGDFAGAFFREEHVARGSTCTDYDRDGDVDLLVCLHGDRPRLLRNDSATGNNWLKLRLRGRPPNTFAVGAEVRIQNPEWSRVHCVGASPSYLSGSVTDVHVGLGRHDGPVTVQVEWPLGGRQSFTVDHVNDTVLIAEGSDVVAFVGDGPRPAMDARAEGDASESVTDAGDRGPLGAMGSRLTGDAYHTFRETFREATRLRVAGEYSAAEAIYRKALEIDPRHVDSHFFLGSVLFDQGRFSEAVACWGRLLEIEPASSKGNFMMGVAHACPLEGAPIDFEAAAEYFRTAFSANKEESGALLRLGEIAVARGDFDGARENLQAAVNAYYSSVDGHFLLAYVLWKTGEDSRAVAEMRLAIEYAKKAGLPARAPTGVLAEGDIEDPAILRLTNLYRVRPLADRCLGLAERCAGEADEAFCEREFAALDARVESLRAR
jgi:TolA-binding protein